MRSHSVSERRESPLHGILAEGEEEACLQRTITFVLVKV